MKSNSDGGIELSIVNKEQKIWGEVTGQRKEISGFQGEPQTGRKLME